MSEINAEDAGRLGLDGGRLRDRLSQVRAARQERGQAFITQCQDIYRSESKPVDTNPDTALYGNFVPNSDKRLMQEVRDASPAELRDRRFAFADSRLPDLLFRYRARNWPEILDDEERSEWREHCKVQWETSEHLNLSEFHSVLEVEERTEGLSEKQQSALKDLRLWVSENAKVLGVNAASV
jgi:exodeoxyribonuclease-1